MADDPLRDPIPTILTVPSLNLLGGASGVGKTSFISGFLKAIQDGAPLFGHATFAPPKLAYISADRPLTSARLWFDQVGLQDVATYSLVDDRAFSTARLERPKVGEHARLFGEILDKLDLPPGALVIADPIALFLAGNLNDYVRCAIGCLNLYRLIQDRRLCVIGIVHSSKQMGDAKQRYGRLQDRLSGSMAQLGYSATQMYLAGPEETDSDHHTFVWNPHHAKGGHFPLQQDGETGLFRLFDPHHRAIAANPDFLPPDLHTLYLHIPPPPMMISTAQLVSLYVDQGLDRRKLYHQLEKLEVRKLVWSPTRGMWQRLLLPTTPATPSESPTQ